MARKEARVSDSRADSPYDVTAGEILAGLVLGIDHIAICVRDLRPP